RRPLLHRRIGCVSLELFNAFPRQHDSTVWNAVGNGFDGGFVPKGARRVGLSAEGTTLAPGSQEEEWRVHRMCEVVSALGPSKWHSYPDALPDDAFFKQPSPSLTLGELRAPPGELLNKAWVSMDRAMVQVAHEYLRDRGGGLSEEQACVAISQWEENMPWGPEQGAQKYELGEG
ncbi:hypothetical protein BD413DRAFT_453931, partial [Trametes elegans]